jgi:hypothetical protein
MSATILKGPVHQATDALVNQDATTRAAFLEALKALQPPDEDHTAAYLEILARHAPQLAHFVVPQLGPVNVLNYPHDTWDNSSDRPTKPRRSGAAGFWSAAHHPTEPVIRQCLITAIELAIEKHLPLDSYWIAAGDRVETLVLCTPQQITRLLVTPPSPRPQNPGHLMNFADIRMIKRGELALWETLAPQQQRGRVIATKLNVM